MRELKILLAGVDPQIFWALRRVAFPLEDVGWVGRTETLHEAMELYRAEGADVLLVEVPIQEQPGDTPIGGILGPGPGRGPGPGIIALSGEQGYEAVYGAVRIGASALIATETPPEFIISTVRRVCNGERPIEYNPMANALLARQLGRAPQADLSSADRLGCPLTRRELEILTLVAQGCSNRQVAGRIAIQEQTVKNYLSSVLRKTEASDRVHAVTTALRNRWISLN